MKKAQVIIISLLIIAILFSVVSMAVNFALGDPQIRINKNVPDSAGRVELIILETPENTGEVVG